MRSMNLPSVGARYWIALMVASVLGATLGDYVSETLGFGFVVGVQHS